MESWPGLCQYSSLAPHLVLLMVFVSQKGGMREILVVLVNN